VSAVRPGSAARKVTAAAAGPVMAVLASVRMAAQTASHAVAWTSFRNGFYAHTLDWLLGPWRETGIIAAPADGPVSWTDRGDEAEAAAVILAGQRPFDGPVTLTADDAVTFGDIAGIAAELTGRDIQRVVMDDDEWVAGQVAHGTPEFLARFLLGVFQAAREGRFAGVDPLLGQLLGRRPRTVRDLLAGR
jgi:NAD(P)H dehydrogenase (quinone)